LVKTAESLYHKNPGTQLKNAGIFCTYDAEIFLFFGCSKKHSAYRKKHKAHILK